MLAATRRNSRLGGRVARRRRRRQPPVAVVLVVVLPTWCGRCRLRVCEKNHVVGYHCGSTNYGMYSVRRHSNNCMALFYAGGEGDAKNTYNSKTTYEYNTTEYLRAPGCLGISIPIPNPELSPDPLQYSPQTSRPEVERSQRSSFSGARRRRRVYCWSGNDGGACKTPWRLARGKRFPRRFCGVEWGEMYFAACPRPWGGEITEADSWRAAPRAGQCRRC